MEDVRVVPLEGVPHPAADVSNATVVADEYNVILGYRLPERPASSWSGPPDARAEEATDTFAVLEIDALVHRFGYPNDEALPGHPLHDAGIQYYSAAEILGSPWPAELEVQNRVHERHSAQMYAGLRHLIFTFHDTTFECVCSNFKVYSFSGLDEELALYMVSILGR